MIPPILCYHKIDTRFELGVTRLGPRSFRRQAEALAAAGFRAVGAADLRLADEHADGAPAESRRRIVLTFDDGYEALDRHAFPVLAGLGMRALVFVVTGFVGAANTWDVRWGGRAFAHLDWDQLGRWQERGIEVHSHGATHRRLTWLSDNAVAEELGRSRETIRARLGAAPLAVCYPFNAVDDRVRRLASAAGYRLGFAGPHAPHPRDLLALPRRPVYAWDVAAPPLVLRDGPIGAAALGAAWLAGRFAVVTSALKQAPPAARHG